MKPKLPRELLWTDLKTMDEFYELEPITEQFYDVYYQICRKQKPSNISAVDVFNEVFYQITSMVYMRNVIHIDGYVAEIKEDLQWEHGENLIMTMIHFLLSLDMNSNRLLSTYLNAQIVEKYSNCSYWEVFRFCAEDIHRRGGRLTHNFRPIPWSVFSFIIVQFNWGKITCNYDINRIEEILNLWPSIQEKQIIATIIYKQIDEKDIYGKSGLTSEALMNFLIKRLSREGKPYEPNITSKFIEEYKSKSYEKMQARLCLENNLYIMGESYQEEIDEEEEHLEKIRKELSEMENEWLGDKIIDAAQEHDLNYYVEKMILLEHQVESFKEELLKKDEQIAQLLQNTSQSTPPMLTTTPHKKTSILVALDAMYYAGWFKSANDEKMPDRNSALADIMNRAFGVTKIDVQQLLSTPGNRSNNRNWRDSYFKELEEALMKCEENKAIWKSKKQ